MEELLAFSGNKIPVLKRGQEVTGKVISISKEELLIDIGAKSEGIVFGREFSSVKDLVANLSPGDSVDAIVVYPENDAGQVVLSLRKLSGEKRWEELAEKKSAGETIDVCAQEVNRGGIICDFLGLRGFLPSSQLQAAGKMNDLIGKTLQVKVIEVDKNTNRLIFSQKRPDETSLKSLQKLLSKVEIGQRYEGVVTAVLPFGLFVEIQVKSTTGTKGIKSSSKKAHDTSDTLDTLPGKLEGLVHISEIAWEKVEDVAKLFKVGDKVEVMVIAKEETTARLNLSIRQLTVDPFAEVYKKYAKDQKVYGTVERMTPYGVFVTLESGVEGMIHISKIPPNETLDVGRSVECVIESVDVVARKIMLVPVSREKPILYR